MFIFLFDFQAIYVIINTTTKFYKGLTVIIMKLKFTTIGSNSIVDKMLTGGSYCPDFELYGVYSRTEDRANEFAKKHGAENTFTSLNAVAQSETDAVYIASPTACHYEQSKFMLERGKHVLCEKPATSNLKELSELLELAEKKNVVYMEAMRPVHSPFYSWIKENLYKIGTIRHVLFTYCQYSSRYDNFKSGIIENAFKPELSNGSLMDIGIYPIHFMVSLFGMPNKIASTALVLKDSIDGCGAITLDYGEFIGEILHSKISQSNLPCEIQGESGNIIFSPVGTPRNAEIVYRNGEKEVADIDLIQWDMYYEIRDFCNMIINGEKPSEFSKYTYDSISITDTVRKQNNIVFPADFK